MIRTAILATLTVAALSSSGCSVLSDMVGLKHPADRRAYIAEHQGKRPDAILDGLKRRVYLVGMTFEEARLVNEGLSRVIQRSNGESIWKGRTLYLHFSRDGYLTRWTRYN